MSITKRTFLSIGGLFCLVLLALNAATYLLFRQSITRQLITSQEAVTEANVQLSHVFTQTTDKLIYQYTSDTELGELLSRPVGRDELEDLNTKSLLNSRMTYHLNAENLLTNNGFRMELYLDPALPVSGLFTPENTIPNVSRVFSGDTVADTEWYRTVRGSTQGRYVFLDETRQRLCFAFKLQNSAYAGAHRKEGLGVLLGSLPLDRLPNLLSIFPLTEHSGFLLLNRQGRQVFCSENLDGLPMDAALPLSGETSTRLDLGGQRFLGTAANLESGLRLVFLTPYSDITGQVWGMMSPYLLCSAVFLALGVLVALGLSAQVSRPVVQFTRKLEAIRDTRSVRPETFAPQGPREIRQLNRSFGELIGRVNALIKEVTRKEDQRRESELRALQAQINPHFMLNAMNAVNYMALARGEDDIAATVDSIASLMRYSITEPDRLVTMSTELDNIREYIAVYVLRFRQDIRLEVLPGLDPAQVVIPKFTLQPLVENSIRHGITRQDPGIVIRIRAAETGGGVCIEVTDTGRGADAALLNDYLDYRQVDLKVTHGFGIRNVNERLQLRFGPGSHLRYANYEGGRLLARLTLPGSGPA